MHVVLSSRILDDFTGGQDPRESPSQATTPNLRTVNQSNFKLFLIQQTACLRNGGRSANNSANSSLRSNDPPPSPEILSASPGSIGAILSCWNYHRKSIFWQTRRYAVPRRGSKVPDDVMVLLGRLSQIEEHRLQNYRAKIDYEVHLDPTPTLNFALDSILPLVHDVGTQTNWS